MPTNWGVLLFLVLFFEHKECRGKKSRGDGEKLTKGKVRLSLRGNFLAVRSVGLGTPLFHVASGNPASPTPLRSYSAYELKQPHSHLWALLWAPPCAACRLSGTQALVAAWCIAASGIPQWQQVVLPPTVPQLHCTAVTFLLGLHSTLPQGGAAPAGDRSLQGQGP